MNQDKLLEYGAIITGAYSKKSDITKSNTNFFQKEYKKHNLLEDLQLEFDQRQLADGNIKEGEDQDENNTIYTKEGEKRMYFSSSFKGEKNNIPAILTQQQISLLREKKRDFLKAVEKYREYDNILMHVRSFQIANQSIILKLLRNNLLKGADENFLLNLIKNYSEEQEIINWIKQKKKKKKFVFNFILNPLFLRVAIIFVIISSAIFGIVGIRYLQVKDIYDRGYQAIINNSINEGENLFEKAFKKWSWIEECHRYAKVYIKQKKYDLAYQKYQTALTSDPKDYETLCFIVKLSIHQKKYKEAEKFYQKINIFYPNDIASLKWLTEMYIEWAKSQPEYLNKAKQILEMLKEKEFFFYLAKKMSIAIFENNYDNVIEFSDSLSTMNPEKVDKIQQKIEKFYNLLTKKYPKEMRTPFLVAEWHFINSEKFITENLIQQAKELWQQEIVPYYFDDSQIFDLLGILEYEKQDYQKARENFTQAIRINERNYNSYYYLGNIFLNRQDYNNSLDMYLRAIEIREEPKQWQIDYEDCLYKIGYSYYQLAKESTGEKKKKYLIDNIFYWNKINLFNRKENKLYIQYIMANSYLLLGEYDLAYGYYANNIAKLQKEYDRTKRNNIKKSTNMENKFLLLTEMENNIAIAETQINSGTGSLDYKKKAFLSVLSSLKKRQKMKKDMIKVKQNLSNIIKDENKFTILDDFLKTKMVKFF